MTDRLTIIPQPIRPVGKPQSKPAVKPEGSGQFNQVLDQAQKKQDIRFSAHAQQRMNARGIQYTQGQIERLNQAVSQVDAKGGRDSLVMLDETALVVSVKNETVVTVVDRENLKQNVFTNIDSAVIA